MSKSNINTLNNKATKRVPMKRLLKLSGFRNDFLAKNLKCSGAAITHISKFKVGRFTKGTVAQRMQAVLLKQVKVNERYFNKFKDKKSGQKGGTAKA